MIRITLTLPLVACTAYYMPKLDYYIQCVMLGVNFSHGSLASFIIAVELFKRYPGILSAGARKHVLSILLFLPSLFGGVAVLSFPLDR